MQIVVILNFISLENNQSINLNSALFSQTEKNTYTLRKYSAGKNMCKNYQTNLSFDSMILLLRSKKLFIQ